MAGTAFQSVTGKVASNYSKDGIKIITGTALGPGTAGADTTIDLSSFSNGKLIHLDVKCTSGTAWYQCQPLITTGGLTPKVNIFSGTTDVAQSSADLSSVTFSYVATVTDYE